MEDIKRFQRIAALLSFALPGLGQIYQSRYSTGLLIFFLFVITSWANASLFLPMISALAALEALRQSPKKQELGREVSSKMRWTAMLDERYPARVRRVRLPLFLILGSLGLAAWMFLFAPNLYLPSDRLQVLETSNRADKLAEKIRQFHGRYHKAPGSLSDCLGHGEKALLVDPWGREFQLKTADGGFELLSAGPKLRGQGLVFRYHF